MLDITFSDGTIYRARLMGSDPFTDIAVLYVPKVPAQKLIPLPLGNSTNIKVGEQVADNWQPLWFIWVTNRWSHQRTRKTPSFKFEFKFALFHTRYNSNRLRLLIRVIRGGPLLNMRGEVVGMTSAIFSNTGEFSGVGLAISSDTMKKVIPLLITNGHIRPPLVRHHWNQYDARTCNCARP